MNATEAVALSFRCEMISDPVAQAQQVCRLSAHSRLSVCHLSACLNLLNQRRCSVLTDTLFRLGGLQDKLWRSHLVVAGCSIW